MIPKFQQIEYPVTDVLCVTFEEKDQVGFQEESTLNEIHKKLNHHPILVLPWAFVKYPVELTNWIVHIHQPTTLKVFPYHQTNIVASLLCLVLVVDAFMEMVVIRSKRRSRNSKDWEKNRRVVIYLA